MPTVYRQLPSQLALGGGCSDSWNEFSPQLVGPQLKGGGRIHCPRPEVEGSFFKFFRLCSKTFFFAFFFLIAVIPDMWKDVADSPDI